MFQFFLCEGVFENVFVMHQLWECLTSGVTKRITEFFGYLSVTTQNILTLLTRDYLKHFELLKFLHRLFLDNFMHQKVARGEDPAKTSFNIEDLWYRIVKFVPIWREVPQT